MKYLQQEITIDRSSAAALISPVISYIDMRRANFLGPRGSTHYESDAATRTGQELFS